MPTLQFKGKNIIWNHHLSVPYHALDDVSKLSYKSEKANGNLIIEGDNLLALKSLLPLYSGQIKCIYIDPPYNTGNEQWVYNDNVNSPLLKDWLGKEVAKDDLTRHDKWLCMITPRLKLLRELLSDNGVMFISIDDNEISHLLCVCDEIFGEENLVNVFSWQSRTSMQNDTDISVNHEYVVAYAKNRKKEDRRLKESNYNSWFSAKEFSYYPLPLDITKFSNPDNDPRGLWKADPFDAPNVRENLTYPIKNPITKEIYYPPEGRCWRTEEVNYKKFLADKRIIFGKSGESRPQLKVFYEEKKPFGEVDTTWFSGNERGTATEATKELQDIFESKIVFNHPKPTRLLRNLLVLATRENDLVLDSFAGSGTTAQAVMDLNKVDGGNRKFILIQMTEASPTDPKKNICKDITRERVKRAIDKFKYKSGFEYMRVGLPMDAESLLSGKLPAVEQFGSYIFYLCTGEKISKPVKKIEKNIYLAGSQGNADVYLIYSQDYEELTRLALNLDMAEKIATARQKRYIVYAPACFLDEDYLRSKQIEFVNIPYGLFQRKENEA